MLEDEGEEVVMLGARVEDDSSGGALWVRERSKKNIIVRPCVVGWR